MKIDETNAALLQEKGDLEGLYIECSKIALSLLSATCRRVGLVLGQDEMDRLSHEVSSRLIEKYKKDPDYKVRGFAKRLGFIVNSVLWNKKEQNWDIQTVPLTDDLMLSGYKDPTDINPGGLEQWALLDILTEHNEGNRIVYVLWRSRSWRAAILGLAKFVRDMWIIDHKHQLLHVYRVFHWRNNGRRKTQNSIGTVQATIRQRARAVEEQRKQSSSRSSSFLASRVVANVAKGVGE